MKKIVLTSNSQGDVSLEQEILGKYATIEKKPCFSEEELIANCKDADAVIAAYEPFTANVMDVLPKLKVISVKAIGVNSIDIEAAKERNIAVTNIPNYCINEVADHVVCLILAINRRLMQFSNSVQYDKLWKFDICKDLVRLNESVLGLLGFGNIARLVAKRFSGFGIKIIANDPYVDQDVADNYGVKMVSIEEIYKNADYISCHLPLLSSTKKIIDKRSFQMMKNTATFINTSRGKVVNEEDLINALNNKEIAYAALDVLEEEYPDMKTHKLCGRENVILTPHIAFYSQSSIRDAKIQTVENAMYYLKGEYEKCNIINGVDK